MITVREGGCLCGAVRYRVHGEPFWAGACHCTLCQKQTGSAFGISVYFRHDQVELLEGPRREYRLHSDEDGRWMITEFCETCGTTLTWTSEMLPDHRGFAGGTFDDINSFEIDTHMWTRSAHHSLVFPEGTDVYTKDAPI